MSEKKEKFISFLKRSSRVNHTIRVLAGVYLLYTAHQIYSDIESAPNVFFVYGAMIFFVIAAIIIGGSSLYALSKFYYAEAVVETEDEEDEYFLNEEVDEDDCDEDSDEDDYMDAESPEDADGKEE